jgi:ADP-heptose:LPS heptosyltransferase
MGYPRILELVRNRYYADAVVSVDSAEVALLYRESQDYPNSLREFLGTFQLIGVIGLKRNPFIHNLREISNARVVVIPPFPPEGEAVHMVDHLLSLPRHLGVPVHAESPHLFFSENDRKGAADFLRHQGVVPDGLLIAVHPGSGSAAKAWPTPRFIDLAENLVSTYEAQILLVVGPGEERIKKKFLRARGSKPPVILDSLPLPHLGAILERCRVFVGNDSGITHMAAAVGIPVVALFGPTDPVRWAPRGRDVGVIREGLSCSPCDRETMSICTPRLCLMEISVDDVYHAVTRRIGEGEKLLTIVQHFGVLDAKSRAP